MLFAERVGEPIRRIRWRARAFVFGAMVAVAGCSSSEASRVDCERLVDHFVVLARHEPTAAQHARYVDECVAMELSAVQRDCALVAADLDALAACELPVPTPGGGAAVPQSSRPGVSP